MLESQGVVVVVIILSHCCASMNVKGLGFGVLRAEFRSGTEGHGAETGVGMRMVWLQW